MQLTPTLDPVVDVVADAQPSTMTIVPTIQRTAVPALDKVGSHPAEPWCLEFKSCGSCGQVFELPRAGPRQPTLEGLPNEVLFHILGFLDVDDLLSASRTNHHLHELSCTPILHHYRIRRIRYVLPPLLWSPSRPTLADLIARHIFLTHNSIISRRLARSLVSIRLSRRLATRPSAETLVERAVLPKECVPGMSVVQVAPSLVAKKKAIEKEKLKDGLRRWIATKWRGEVMEREEGMRRTQESRGVGRVWRLRKFWERVSRGDTSHVGTSVW